ncbi:hypothetical protein ACFSYH_14350, partial [Populibacterium corticicola]
SGDQDGTPSGDQDGTPSGDQDGTPSGDQDGTPSGDQDGTPSGDQDGTPSGDQDGTPSGDQDGTPSGDQDGTPSGDQDGTPSPTVDIDTETVKHGDTITVTGTGFTAGEKVTITITGADGKPVTVGTAVVGEDGTFSASVSTEKFPIGTVVVLVADESGRTAQGQVTVASASERVLQSSVTIPTITRGRTQVFTATGFEPGETVNGHVHSRRVDLPQQRANESGTVTWEFVVPTDFALGEHVATAESVAYGDSTRSSFTVVADASVTTVNTPTGGTPTGTTPTRYNPLAKTGFSIGAGPLAVTGLLVAGGLLLVMSGKRRRI